MTNIKWSILGVLAAATPLAACDPYEDQSTAAPVVVAVTATSGTFGAYTEGTASAGAWTVADVPSTCAAGVVTSDQPVLFATSNQLLDGASIQMGDLDCTPTGSPATPWLTATPPAPGGEAWYSCFSPGSPSPTLGSSVVIFRSASGGVSRWDTASLTEADNDVVTPYTFTGSVRDWQGQSMAVNVTVNVAPNPGVPGDPTFSVVTTTSVVVSWTAAECESAGNTTYRLERGPTDTGPWTVVSSGSTALTFIDTGLTTATTYWYRVTARTSTGYDGPTSGATSVTTL